MKELNIICVQTTEYYYSWQVHSWLESLKQLNLSNKAIVILYQPYNTKIHAVWQEIFNLYPEATFKIYEDDTNSLKNLIRIYPPIIRPFCLSMFWKDVPEMENAIIFYTDSDVLFTPNFTLEGLLNDNVCYLSDTNCYINLDYFESKHKDVIGSKKQSFVNLDVASKLANLVGISPDIIRMNNKNSGGAQYLLKNISVKFWNKVLNDTILIFNYLSKVNKFYFESEEKGIQKWCADMWAILYNLWYDKQTTKVIPQLDFAWATDNINKLQTIGIYHNAGVTSDVTNGYNTFNKIKYIKGLNPLEDSYLDIILNNEQSKKHCTHYYTKEVYNLKKFKLNY